MAHDKWRKTSPAFPTQANCYWPMNHSALWQLGLVVTVVLYFSCTWVGHCERFWVKNWCWTESTLEQFALIPSRNSLGFSDSTHSDGKMYFGIDHLNPISALVLTEEACKVNFVNFQVGHCERFWVKNWYSKLWNSLHLYLDGTR